MPCSSSNTAKRTPQSEVTRLRSAWGPRSNRLTATRTRTFVSTSYAERQNLNIRMQNRRFTRLTNAFSKKAEMLAYSLAITFLYHNFVRVHQTIKTTPAIKAGIANRKWTVEDMVELLPLNLPGKRGPESRRKTSDSK